MNIRLLAFSLMVIGFSLILAGMTLITYTDHARGSADIG
jgi:hypothetical protein